MSFQVFLVRPLNAAIRLRFDLIHSRQSLVVQSLIKDLRLSLPPVFNEIPDVLLRIPYRVVSRLAHTLSQTHLVMLLKT